MYSVLSDQNPHVKTHIGNIGSGFSSIYYKGNTNIQGKTDQGDDLEDLVVDHLHFFPCPVLCVCVYMCVHTYIF